MKCPYRIKTTRYNNTNNTGFYEVQEWCLCIQEDCMFYKPQDKREQHREQYHCQKALLESYIILD